MFCLEAGMPPNPVAAGFFYGRLLPDRRIISARVPACNSAACIYVTTNQETRSRSRFRPARPLAPSSRAPAPSVALPQPRHFAAFRACRKSAWLDKGDRHQRPAQCLLRSPSASRTAISGVSYPNATAIPADSFPFTLNHRRAAYRAPVPWLSNFSSRDYASLRPARLPHMSAAGASVIAAGAIRGFALAHTLVHLYISDLHVYLFTCLRCRQLSRPSQHLLSRHPQ